MDKKKIIDLLKDNNEKLHPKEWEYTVSLTHEILVALDKINQIKTSTDIIKEEEKLATKQNISPEIKEYNKEQNKLINSMKKVDEELTNKIKINESLSNDLKSIKNQIISLKSDITNLEHKEEKYRTQHHHLKKIEKMESIEKNQQKLEKKKEKLQKLSKKKEKYQAQLKKLEKKKLNLEKAPKIKELESIDLVAFEAPIPLGLRKNSLILSDDDDDNDSSNNSNDDDSNSIIDTQFSLNKMTIKKRIDNSYKSSITAIKFAYIKPLIAMGNENGTVIVTKYSHEKTQKKAEFSFPKGKIISVDFGPNDEHFLASCSDLTVRLYKTKGWSLLNENNKFKKSIDHAEFFNSNHKYVSCGKDNKIRIYDINKSKSFEKLKTSSHPYYVSSSLGNHQLLSGHSDSSVLLWDTKSGKQVNSFKFNKAKVIQVLAVSDSTIISLSINKLICVTDLRNSSLVGTIDVSCTNFDSFATRMAVKENLVVLGGQDGSVYSWSLKTFQLVSHKEICKNQISVVDIKHDQNKIAIGDSLGSTLIYY